MPLDAEAVKNLVDSLIEANKVLKRLDRSLAYASEKLSHALGSSKYGDPEVDRLQRLEGMKMDAVLTQRRYVEALEKKALDSWK